MIKIGIVGNPNSGKTSLFNWLTGETAKIGNWASVTVASREGELKEELRSSFNLGDNVLLVDLPGSYSVDPYSEEERQTQQYLFENRLDIIVNVIDVTALNRSLFFTTQLLETTFPSVILLNKMDLFSPKIDLESLSEELERPVVALSSKQKTGLNELLRSIENVVNDKQVQNRFHFTDEKGVKNSRIDFVAETLDKVVEEQAVEEDTFSDKIDALAMHPIVGIPIFIGVIWLIFALTQVYVGAYFQGWIENFFEILVNGLNTFFEIKNINPILASLVSYGLVAGVGAVLSFLPLIMVLFFLLGILEECGYISRVGVILDPLLKKIGLSGLSAIPMIMASACAIPAIMATRTIKNERNKRMTSMLAPFIPCSAKVVVIALVSGVFFPDKSWVAPVVYLLSVLIIIIAGFILRAITGADFQQTNYFIIELPPYQWPSLKHAYQNMMESAKSFIYRATTIIILCNAIVWFLQSYDLSFQLVSAANPDASILAVLASPIAFLLIPLGFGVWQFAAASITGIVAKENVVGTLAIVFLSSINQIQALGEQNPLISIGGLTALSAFSFLVFNLYTPPCFASISTMHMEMKSKIWTVAGISFQLIFGYFIAFLIFQFGNLFANGEFARGATAGFIALGVTIVLGFALALYSRRGRDSSAAMTPTKEN